MATPFRDGPAFVADTSDDLYVPASGTYALIRHVHLVNTDSSARTVSIFLGATGAESVSTCLLKDKSIAVGDTYDLYFPSGLKVTATDFLVGDASVTNVVTATITGELYVA